MSASEWIKRSAALGLETTRVSVSGTEARARFRRQRITQKEIDGSLWWMRDPRLYLQSRFHLGPSQTVIGPRVYQ